MVVCLTATFGTVDGRVEAAPSWLPDQLPEDGGWNCETIRSGSRHGSSYTTIQTLEALQSWTLGSRPDATVEEVASRGCEFSAVHRMYRSHATGEIVDPGLIRMVFPAGWHHDLLRGLDQLQAAGAPTDSRLGDEFAMLRSKRRSDGRWTINAPNPGRYGFRLEQFGQPSRMNTLRGLPVLRWWTRTHDDST